MSHSNGNSKDNKNGIRPNELVFENYDPDKKKKKKETPYISTIMNLDRPASHPGELIIPTQSPSQKTIGMLRTSIEYTKEEVERMKKNGMDRLFNKPSSSIT